MCDKVVCDKEVWQICVCKIMCDKVACVCVCERLCCDKEDEARRRRRRRRTRRRWTGYRTINKNPTQMLWGITIILNRPIIYKRATFHGHVALPESRTLSSLHVFTWKYLYMKFHGWNWNSGIPLTSFNPSKRKVEPICKHLRIEQIERVNPIKHLETMLWNGYQSCIFSLIFFDILCDLQRIQYDSPPQTSYGDCHSPGSIGEAWFDCKIRWTSSKCERQIPWGWGTILKALVF